MHACVPDLDHASGLVGFLLCPDLKGVRLSVSCLGNAGREYDFLTQSAVPVSLPIDCLLYYQCVEGKAAATIDDHSRNNILINTRREYNFLTQFAVPVSLPIDCLLYYQVR